MKFLENKKLVIILLISLVVVNGISIFFFVKMKKNNDGNEKNIIDYIEYEESEVNNEKQGDIKKDNEVSSDSTNNNIITDNSNISSNNSSNTTNSNVAPPKKEKPKQNNTTPKKEIISATKEYYCTGDYKLDGTKCYSIFSAPAIENYYCDKGTLDGNKCIINSVVPYTPDKYGVAGELCESYSGTGYYENCVCNKDGGTWDGQNCYKSVTTSTNASVGYRCTGDLVLDGNMCYKLYELDAMYKYTCPSGYTLIGTNCEK